MRYVYTLPTESAIRQVLHVNDRFVWSFKDSPYAILVQRVERDDDLEVYIIEPPAPPMRIEREPGMSVETLVHLLLEGIAYHLRHRRK